MPKRTEPTKTKRPDRQTATSSLSDKLEQLPSALPIFYMTLMSTYLDAGGQLNPYIIDSYLPSRALELAQSCGLIFSSEAEFIIPTCEPLGSPPVFPDGAIGPDETAIGPWAVSNQFKDDFMRLLDKATSQARRIAEAHPPNKWKTPTPAVRVIHFLKELAWPKTQLIEKLADTLTGYKDAVQAAKKQLRVITAEPKDPNVLKDYHVFLCQVMKDHSPTCRDLEPLDLCWRRP